MGAVIADDDGVVVAAATLLADAEVPSAAMRLPAACKRCTSTLQLHTAPGRSTAPSFFDAVVVTWLRPGATGVICTITQQQCSERVLLLASGVVCVLVSDSDCDAARMPVTAETLCCLSTCGGGGDGFYCLNCWCVPFLDFYAFHFHLINKFLASFPGRNSICFVHYLHAFSLSVCECMFEYAYNLHNGKREKKTTCQGLATLFTGF